MSKRNSRYSIFKILRMVLRSFPVRQELQLRVMLAARIEADEATGEIFGRDGKSARQVIQETANIPHETSMEKGLKTLREAGLFKAHRIYSRGQRAGGDRIILDWDAWDAQYEKVMNAVKDCPQLNGGQAEPCPQLNGGHPPQLNGGQGPQLNGGQQYIRNTATVTTKSTAMGHANGVPATPSSTPASSADESSPMTTPGVGGELQMQEPEVVEPGEGISWVEPSTVPPGYISCIWFDRALGKLSLINSDKGRAFYRGLRDEGYAPGLIQRGIMAAGAKAPGVRPRNGGYEALIRTYVGYAQERETAAGGASTGRTGAFQRPRAFQP